MARKKKNFPKPVSPTTVAIRAERQTIEKFSGPLPSPDMFVGYREVKPDLPELIVAEWLKEGETRRQYARAYQLREAVKLGIVGIFSLGMLALATWLIYKGRYELGVTVLLSPLVAKILGSLRIR